MTTETVAIRIPPTETTPTGVPATGIVVYAPPGHELTVRQGGEFREAMLALTDAPGCAWILLDATGLDCIDSAGLRVLVDCQKRLEERGGGVAVCGAGPFVRRAFEITRLCRIFTMADSVEDGRNRLSLSARPLTQEATP